MKMFQFDFTEDHVLENERVLQTAEDVDFSKAGLNLELI